MLRYAVPMVANSNYGPLQSWTAHALKSDLNFAALMRVIDGIANDVLDRAAQQVPHTGDGAWVQSHNPDGAIPALGFKVGVRGNFPHERIEFDVVAIHPLRAAFPTSKRERVPDEFIEPPRFAFDPVQGTVDRGVSLLSRQAKRHIQARQR